MFSIHVRRWDSENKRGGTRWWSREHHKITLTPPDRGRPLESITAYERHKNCLRSDVHLVGLDRQGRLVQRPAVLSALHGNALRASVNRRLEPEGPGLDGQIRRRGLSRVRGLDAGGAFLSSPRPGWLRKDAGDVQS